MNQILYKCIFENNNSSNNKKKKFVIILVCSISLIVIATFIYFFTKYELSQNEKLSKDLASNFNIMTLYSNSTNNYTATQIISENEEPFIIGLIQINKINLTYPILSATSEELLKISPCRFYGPMPNEVGNLCIAGHNYIDNTQFGKVNNLNINDFIKISDLDGNFIEYEIYDKKQISANDLSCTEQNTNGLREITLITCNNIKGNRVCIKAREKVMNP